MDCDVIKVPVWVIRLSAIVTSGYTDKRTLLVFGRSRLRAPPTRARAGEARARPGGRGIIRVVTTNRT